MKHTTSTFVAIAAMLAATPALASSDYLLQIDGVKGEAVAPIEVESWSFGVCNAGACSSGREAASGMATGKRQHEPVTIQASQNSQSLRESPSKASLGKTAVTDDATGAKTTPRGGWDVATNKGGRSAGGGAGGQVNVATGDVDGDGMADLAFAATQDEVYGLSFTFQKIPMEYAAVCASGHIDNATVSHGDEVYAVSSVSVVCTKGGSGAAAASYARSGINTVNSMPSRLSMTPTSAKQTRGATFGEKCQSGLQCGGGMVTMTFTGGQMKHTKTGHVTLLK
ncbi:MAG: hypothetical protein ACKOPG_05710 [Novosphingobium sp.]